MKKIYSNIFLFLFLIIPTIDFSQISLVTDFNDKPNSTIFRQFVQADRLTYFLIRNNMGNSNLWRTDGTTEGTILLTTNLDFDALELGNYTIQNGVLFFFKHGYHNELWKTDGTIKGTVKLASYIQNAYDNIVNINGTIYFSASDSLHGEELWKTDGTDTGTYLVKDLRPGVQSSYPTAFIACDGLLIFKCYGGIWRSNGTASGTFLLNDIDMYFSRYSYPGYQIYYKNNVYFIGTDGIHGNELWKTDGTVDGTVLVKDINPGPSSSYPLYFIDGGNYVFFIANDGINGNNLWRTDGTENGTILVVPLKLSGFSWNYTVLNNVLYTFFNSDGHSKLWKTDGTITGTSLVIDFYYPKSNYYNEFLEAINGILYFNGYDSLHGDGLWKSDGTQEGTEIAIDIAPGEKSSHPRFLNYFNGKLFLNIEDSLGYTDIWSYDVANGSLVLLKDFLNTGSIMQLANSSDHSYLFDADDGISGNELWLTDGTVEGTILLKDISPGTQSANIFGTNSWNDKLIFIAWNEYTKYGLYITNGTPTGLKLVKNFGHQNPNTCRFFNHSGNQMFFTIDDGIHGSELWISNGTESGTELLKDIYPGNKSSNISEGLYLNGILYFFATDSIHGQALWKSDGTSDGTVLVKVIYPGTNLYYSAYELCGFGHRFVFTGNDSIHGQELWISDGTDTGTYMVKDIVKGLDGHVHKKIFFHNQLFFGARDYTYLFHLWKTDGSEIGTTLVSDTSLWPNGREFSKLAIFNDALYFTINDSFERVSLYKSDGNIPGTRLVKVLYKKGYSGEIEILDSIMVFTVYNSDKNCDDIWRSDGTDAGTYVIKSFHHDAYSQFNDNAILNNKIYFQANDSVHGSELWCSDGTKAGTTMVGEINSGIESSLPQSFRTNGKEVFFIANSNFFGKEIYKYSPSPAPIDQSYGLEFYNVQKRQMSIRWTRGNGEKCIVFMKKGNSGIPDLHNGKTYKASDIFSMGSWSDDREWYCIYNGTGNNVTVRGLQPATEYRIMVIEYNGNPGHEYYNCSLTGYNAGNQYTRIDASSEEPRDIKIYPNPSKGWLIISDIEDCSVVMYNHGGKLVNDFYSTSDLQLLDISQLASGIYILKIIGKNTCLTRKIMLVK